MPEWKEEVRRRLVSLKLEPGREASIVEEVSTYLDDLYAELLARGVTPAEAYQEALGELGNSALLTRELRRAAQQVEANPVLPGTNRRKNMISDLWHDLRYGARMLWKHKGITAISVLSLALGIGANTAIFSLIDAVLLRTLPVEQPEQLVFIQNVGPRRPDGGAPPYPCFERFSANNHFFTALAAFNGFDPQLKIDGQLEEVRGQRVSGNYFDLLGVKATLGRTFSTADDVVAGPGVPDGLVAVISYNYWTKRFGRQPTVIGKVIQTGDRPMTIIGVAPPEFSGLTPGAEFDIWLPISSVGPRLLAQKDTWWFQAVGRLKPGAAVGQAQAELDGIFQSYMDDLAWNAEGRRDVFSRIDLRPADKGGNSLRQEFSRPLQALMAIVALVLLIACANVANLLLARATARRKEFASRLTLGASRSRLVRQVLTESLLLVTLGGLGGLIFARWGGNFVISFFGTGRTQLFLKLPLDYRMLLFTAGVALLTGLIFGLAPALQATRVDLNGMLKDSADSGIRGRRRFGKSLLVAQVAVSLLLLVVAGLFLRTLYNLKTLDAGFRPEGVLTMRINPPAHVIQADRLANFWYETLGRIKVLPGVRSASLTALSPLDGSDRSVRVDIAGFMPAADEDRVLRMNQVSPGYFQTLGIPVQQGRGFTDADTETSPKVLLLNQAASRFYFGDRSPIGAHIRFPQRDQPAPSYEIVGVVKDSRYENLRAPETPLMYLPLKQARDRLARLVLAVRTAVEPSELTNSIVKELRAVDADTLVTDVATLYERVDESLVKERVVATLALFFGILAPLLACIGLYGMASYDVEQRTHEIGIRMALGAEETRVVRLVLREALWSAVMGVGLGLVAALAATRWLESLLFGLEPHDPLTITLAAILLLTVAAVAAYVPARGAARVDPLLALRHE